MPEHDDHHDHVCQFDEHGRCDLDANDPTQYVNVRRVDLDNLRTATNDSPDLDVIAYANILVDNAAVVLDADNTTNRAANNDAELWAKRAAYIDAHCLCVSTAPVIGVTPAEYDTFLHRRAALSFALDALRPPAPNRPW